MALVKKHNAGGKADFREHVTKKLLTDTSLSAREQELINQGLNTFEPNEEESLEVSRVGDENEAASWLNNEHKQFNTSIQDRTVDLEPEGGYKQTRRVPNLLKEIIEKDFGGNEDAAIRHLGEMTNNNDIKKFLIKKTKDIVGRYNSGAVQESIYAPDNLWENKREAEELQHVVFGIDEDKEITEKDWNDFTDRANKLGWDVGNFLHSDEDLDRFQKQRDEKELKYQKEKQKAQLKGLGLNDENLALLDKFAIDREYEPLEDHSFLQDMAKEKGYTLVGSEDGSTHMFIDKDGDIVKNAAGLISSNQLDDLYGASWGIDNSGALQLYNPGDYESNKFLDLDDSLGEDLYDKNIGRQVLTDDPKYSDYSIIAYSDDDFQGNVGRDAFGRRDFRSKYVFSKDDEEFEVIRGEDGIYRKDNKKFTMPKGLKFGDDVTEEKKDYVKTYLEHAGSPLSNARGKEYNKHAKSWKKELGVQNNINNVSYSLNQVSSDLARFEKEYKAAKKDSRNVDIPAKDALKVASFLKFVLTNDAYPIEYKEKAEELIKKFTNFATKTVYNKETKEQEPLFNTGLFSWRLGGNIERKEDINKARLTKWNKGGTIKLADGGYLDAANKLAQSRTTPFSPEKEKEKKQAQTGYFDSTGTVGDANVLDWISTAGSVASFVPVLGIAGGLVSTAADAANAWQRGEWTSSDTVNLLSNIGFTALAGIGLGATKGFKVAGKVGQIANRTKKLGRVGKAVNTVTSAGAKAAKAGSKTVDAAKTVGLSSKIARTASTAASKADKIGDKATYDIANKVLNLANKTDSKTMAKLMKGELANDVAKITELAAVKTSTVGRAAQGIGKGAKQLATLAPSAIGTTAKWGLGAVQVGGGVKGAINVGGNIIEEGSLVEGVKKSQISDVRNMLQTGALGWGYNQNRLNARAMRNQTKNVYTSSGKPQTSIEVIGKDGKAIRTGIKVSSDADLSGYKPGRMDKIKSKAPKWMSKKDPVSDSLESYKSKLKKHLSKKEFESVSEALDKGATIRVNTTPGKVKATVLKDLDSNDPKTIRERIRAERILRTGSANYFAQFRNRNNVFTETEFNNLPGNRKPQLLLEAAPTKNKLGGVLKFRAGKNLPWNNVSWNPNLTPPGNPFISNPSLLYPNINPEILEGSFSQKPETESSETKPVNTYTPSIHSSYNGFYRKWNPDRVRMGEGFKFDTDISLYWKRKRRQDQTTESGIYLGQEDPKYDLNIGKPGVKTKEQKDIGRLAKETLNPIFEGHDNPMGPDLSAVLEGFKKKTIDRANEASASNMIRGTQHTAKPTLSHRHLTTQTPQEMFARKQASDIRSAGRRIGNSTSDSNLAAATQLESQKQAADIIAQGMANDINSINKTREQQVGMDANIDYANNQITARNIAGSDQSHNAKFNILGNLAQQKGLNDASFVDMIKHYADPTKIAKDKLHREYMQVSSNPNITNAQQHYAQQTSKDTLERMKASWDEQQRIMAENVEDHKPVDFYDSEYYRDHMKSANKSVAPYTSLAARAAQLRQTLQNFNV